MGRGVYVPPGSTSAYVDVSWMGMVIEDDDDNDEIMSENFHYDEMAARDDWDNWVDNVKRRSRELMPSLIECDIYFPDGRAVLINQFCYIGVSEYCGLAAVWLCPHEGCTLSGLQRFWFDTVKEKFVRTFAEYRRLGAMSNGESVYERCVDE